MRSSIRSFLTGCCCRATAYLTLRLPELRGVILTPRIFATGVKLITALTFFDIFINHEKSMTVNIDERLDDLGITIPEPRTPSANYIPFVKTGNLVYISGQVSMTADGLIAGKLGLDIDLETGQKAARACGLNLIAQLKVACNGTLNQVTRVVKLGGFVNATTEFITPPTVINGASDLMVEIFGEAGRHARFAIGTASLPQGAAVEIDGIFEVE